MSNRLLPDDERPDQGRHPILQTLAPVVLFGLALVVRLAFSIRFPDPGYPDSYYYVNVARALGAGAGFNIDFIWTFVDVGGRLPEVAQLPIPSNAHWMPLASIIQVPFILALGPVPLASTLPFIIIGALAAPLAWSIAHDLGAPRWVGFGAGVLTAIPGLSTVFFSQPDNFGLFQVLAAGALLMASRGLKGSHRAFVAAGGLVGLAALSRADGILLAAVLGLTFAWSRVSSRRGLRHDRWGVIPIWAGVASFGLFLTVVAPWWMRQLAVFGAISPSSASGRILWIRSLDEMNSITTDATLSGLLSQGIGPLIMSRIGGLSAAVSIFVIMVGVVVLIAPMVVGAWTHRQSSDFGPFFAYAAILFGFSSIVSAVHVPNGTFIHSAVALLPHAYVLALAGVSAWVTALARRRSRWEPRRSAPVFAGMLIVLVATAGLYFGLGVQSTWDTARRERVAIDRELDARGVAADERLMAIDGGGYRYYTGRPTIVTPGDDLATIERVARAYGIRWLVLERDQIVPALAPILEGGARQPWLGRSVYTEHDASGAPILALLPVCTSRADDRCLSALARPRDGASFTPTTGPPRDWGRGPNPQDDVVRSSRVTAHERPTARTHPLRMGHHQPPPGEGFWRRSGPKRVGAAEGG